MQIAYGGSATSFEPENRKLWGQSAVPYPSYKTIPPPMTQDYIATVVSTFANAA